MTAGPRGSGRRQGRAFLAGVGQGVPWQRRERACVGAEGEASSTAVPPNCGAGGTRGPSRGFCSWAASVGGIRFKCVHDVSAADPILSVCAFGRVVREAGSCRPASF